MRSVPMLHRACNRSIGRSKRKNIIMLGAENNMAGLSATIAAKLLLVWLCSSLDTSDSVT